MATFSAQRSVTTAATLLSDDPDALAEADVVLRNTDGAASVFIGGPTITDSDGVDEVQVVTISGAPTGGSFKLTFQGQQTATIAYNAAAATVESALEALSNLAPADVAVAGSAGGPYTVTFSGVFAHTDVGLMTADATGLTGGTSPSVAVATTVEARYSPGFELVAGAVHGPLKGRGAIYAASATGTVRVDVLAVGR